MKPPPALERPAAAVEARLATMLDEEEARWAVVDPDLAVPLSRLRSFVRGGGKRVRPAFCYWSFLGSGGGGGDRAVTDAGSALEMLHAAALVHDDVIDRSDRRHGSPSLHVQFASLHRGGRWAGDPERFGDGMAILVGDLALVYSSRLLAAAPPEARAVFEEMRLEVNAGQYLDVLGAAQGLDDGAAERARRICRYKTTRYTVERPMHLGAALADPCRLESRKQAISAFAVPLGDAFQLTDDLLGVFGDPAVTGKPVGDDLRHGKPTLLAALAAGRGPQSGRRRFRSRFGAADLDDTDVAAMQEHISASGARSEVEAEVASLLRRSETARRKLPFTAEAVQALGDIAAFVAARDR